MYLSGYMRVAEQLKWKVYEALKDVEAKKVGVAFSGGVDSSVLAKVCKDMGKEVTLLTIGFSRQRDIEISQGASETLGPNLLHDLVPLEELEDGLRTVLATIEFDRLVRLENCASFYYVFRLASEHELGTVLSANGIDELFCGYHAYKEVFGNEEALKSLMTVSIETAKKDKKEIDKLSALFSVEYMCPFLSEAFIDFAMDIPFEFKIKGKDDDMRKHVLREVALEIGVPGEAALRAKKALQYSSGIHKAILELAVKKGFAGNKAKFSGLRRGMVAYIDSLRSDLKQARSMAYDRTF